VLAPGELESEAEIVTPPVEEVIFSTSLDPFHSAALTGPAMFGAVRAALTPVSLPRRQF
jgi:hypothetical protein